MSEGTWQSKKPTEKCFTVQFESLLKKQGAVLECVCVCLRVFNEGQTILKESIHTVMCHYSMSDVLYVEQEPV